MLLGRADRAFWKVGVDGVDGAGKTWLADELAREVEARGMPCVRVTLDGFHNPRLHRYRLGRDSPEGFFRDSYDYDRFRELVLEPLSPGGSGRYVPAIYDVQQEQPADPAPQQASAESVVVVDGIFLHRDEVAGWWDFSIWLEVPFEIAIPRGAARGHGFGNADPSAPSNRRYVEGQRLYINASHPATRASVIVDNRDLDNPTFVDHL
jgi:uridine kinase